MSTEHTPGPWRRKGPITGPGCMGTYLVGRDDVIVCDPYGPNPQDAPLIEAAPDLLAALRNLVASEAPYADQDNLIEARAAIAKAEGLL